MRPSRSPTVCASAGERCGVARPRREQDAVVRGERVGVDVVREHVDRSACGREPAQDRALAAVVDDRDAHSPFGGEGVRLVRRNAGDECCACHLRLRAHRRQHFVDVARVADGSRAHRSAVAQMQDERTCVDAGQPDDAVLVQPVRPVRPARLAHDDCSRVRATRLRPCLVDAVVADHRRREADELPLEARIGRDLLVAAHRRGEHGLAERESLGADRLAGEDGAVLEHERGAHWCTT